MYSTVIVYMCEGLLQPQLERVAIEALQLCTLLLPPASRRKLQLLMRMISRMSQNVDMPRLHDAIGTRTLVRAERNAGFTILCDDLNILITPLFNPIVFPDGAYVLSLCAGL